MGADDRSVDAVRQKLCPWKRRKVTAAALCPLAGPADSGYWRAGRCCRGRGARPQRAAGVATPKVQWSPRRVSTSIAPGAAPLGILRFLPSHNLLNSRRTMKTRSRPCNAVFECLTLVILVAGCASTQESNYQQLATGPIPRPNQIWVYDFAASPADVPPESALAGQSAYAAPQTPD